MRENHKYFERIFEKKNWNFLFCFFLKKYNIILIRYYKMRVGLA